MAESAKRAARRSASVVVSVALAALVGGCKDAAKESATKAGDDIKALNTLIESDVAEVERGLPPGATKLAPMFAAGMEDQRKDLAYLRQRLIVVRREVPDLAKAKSTFFALTDAQGVAMRNDMQEDTMAGTNLVTAFPELGKALSGASPLVETMGGLEATKNGHDLAWIAATPIKSADPQPTIVGLYVTGWTLRSFARHLSETRKHDFIEAAKANGGSGEGTLPIEYVAVFTADAVYPAALTPQVDEDALAGLHLAQVTANGPANGTMTLTDRAFGWAAMRTPKLGPNAGVVVLRSEI